MKHNREKDLQKVLSRKRTWDYFHWYYFEQFHRLWKDHWLKCNCQICEAMREEKKMLKRKERYTKKSVIQEQLEDLE